MNAPADRLRHGATARLADGLVLALALGAAYLLKDYHGRAGFDGLRWILGPTAGAVAWLTGAAFEVEAHQGYLSRELLFTIVPSCSGVNFMIAAFSSLTCGLVFTQRTPAAKLALLPLGAVAAYGVTILANAVRIAIAARLHLTGAEVGFLTPARLHRLEGIVVYFLFLCLSYGLAAGLLRTRGAQGPS